MSVEAELKARLWHPEKVASALRSRAEPERADYFDTYYDNDAGFLDRGQRELRLRTQATAHGNGHVLTYKDRPVDAVSGSKPEHETELTQPAALDILFRALGYQPVISLTKHCENFRFDHEGRSVLATIVRVPELEGTFLEVETMVAEGDVNAALAALHRLLTQLGVSEDSLTTELYTEAVAAQRQFG
jgi:adenylate cyclase class 2